MSNENNLDRDTRGVRFFTAWAQWVITHRWLCVAVMSIVTVIAAREAARSLRVDNGIDSFFVGNDPSKQALDELRGVFGRDELLLVVVEGDVFTRDYLDRLRALHDDIAALDIELESPPGRGAPAGAGEDIADDADFADFADEGSEPTDAWGDVAGGSIVDEIVSILNARRTIGSDGGVTVMAWLEPLPPADELPTYRQLMLEDDQLTGRLLDRYGRYSIIAVRTHEMGEKDEFRVHAALTALADKHDAEGFRIGIGGVPAVGATLASAMVRDLERMLTLALLVMTILLFILFRHPWGVIGPMVVVCLATVWMVGAMAYLDIAMTMVTNVLPVFVLCVGVGDAVHVQSVYGDLRSQGVENRAAVVRAVGTTGIPCLLTSATTAVGLLSFHSASLEAVRELGTAGALGVSFALLHSVVTLPVILTFNRRSTLGRRRSATPDVRDRALRAFSRASRTRRGSWIVVGVTAAVTVAAVTAAVSRLEVRYDPIEWLPDSSPTKRAVKTIDEHVSGVVNVNLLVEPAEGLDARNLALLRGLEALERHILTFRHPRHGHIVSGAVSILDVLRETNRALHADDQAHYVLPSTPRGVTDMLFLFENSAREQLSRVSTLSYEQLHMSFHVKWMTVGEYAGLIDHINAGIAQHVDPALGVVRPTGAVYTQSAVMSRILGDMLRSFAIAVVAVALLMIVLLGQVRLGLIAMAPNVIPVLLLGGVMAAFGIPLDLVTLLTGAIVIGLAVDDTVHFFHHFRTAAARGLDCEDALTVTMQHAGRAIVSTTCILVAGFAVYMGAEMLSLIRFGVLVCCALAFALVLDLVVGPALLRLAYRGRERAEKRVKEL